MSTTNDLTIVHIAQLPFVHGHDHEGCTISLITGHNNRTPTNPLCSLNGKPIIQGRSVHMALRISNDTLQFVAVPSDSAHHYLIPALQAHQAMFVEHVCYPKAVWLVVACSLI